MLIDRTRKPLGSLLDRLGGDGLLKRREVLLTATLLDPYRQGILAEEFRRAFGTRLVITGAMPGP